MPGQRVPGKFSAVADLPGGGVLAGAVIIPSGARRNDLLVYYAYRFCQIHRDDESMRENANLGK
jgi:hypothetical protein